MYHDCYMISTPPPPQLPFQKIYATLSVEPEDTNESMGNLSVSAWAPILGTAALIIIVGVAALIVIIRRRKRNRRGYQVYF